MKSSAVLLAVMVAACSTMPPTSGPSGAVERKDVSTLLVTYYRDRDMRSRTFVVPSSSRNYEAYLDMVGGSVAVGEKKQISCSIGRVSMLPNGDLIYNIAPQPGRPEAVETVEQGSERYQSLLQMYSDLTPGHSRPIQC